MDPRGCLAAAGGDGAPPPFVGSFVLGSGSFLLATAAAVTFTRAKTGGPRPTPHDIAVGRARFGVPGAATITLLVKLAAAFCVPQLVAFASLLAANGGKSGTALADMACIVGSGFPVLAALFGGLAILFVLTSSLRERHRGRLLAGCAPCTTCHRSASRRARRLCCAARRGSSCCCCCRRHGFRRCGHCHHSAGVRRFWHASLPRTVGVAEAQCGGGHRHWRLLRARAPRRLCGGRAAPHPAPSCLRWRS
jgi:hypothetical protein